MPATRLNKNISRSFSAATRMEVSTQIEIISKSEARTPRASQNADRKPRSMLVWSKVKNTGPNPKNRASDRPKTTASKISFAITAAAKGEGISIIIVQK